MWYAGGSRFWVWGRGEDGTVLYLFWGLCISCSISLPCRLTVIIIVFFYNTTGMLHLKATGACSGQYLWVGFLVRPLSPHHDASSDKG